MEAVGAPFRDVLFLLQVGETADRHPEFARIKSTTRCRSNPLCQLTVACLEMAAMEAHTCGNTLPKN